MIFNYLLAIYPYLCCLLAVIGILYKSQYLYKIKLTKLTEQHYMLGTATLNIILIHFIGYILIKLLLLLFNIELVADSLAKNVVNFIILSFLTMIIMLAYKDWFRSKQRLWKNLPDALMLLVIFLHIIAGFYTILWVDAYGIHTSLDQQLLNDYFIALLNLDITNYQYIMQVPFVTVMHIFLGMSFIALLPYSSIVEAIYFYIRRLFTYI